MIAGQYKRGTSLKNIIHPYNCSTAFWEDRKIYRARDPNFIA